MNVRIPGVNSSVNAQELLVNRLIPMATKEARARVRKSGRDQELREHRGETYVHDFWSEYFHEAMDRMTREQGLRSW